MFCGVTEMKIGRLPSILIATDRLTDDIWLLLVHGVVYGVYDCRLVHGAVVVCILQKCPSEFEGGPRKDRESPSTQKIAGVTVRAKVEGPQKLGLTEFYV